MGDKTVRPAWRSFVAALALPTLGLSCAPPGPGPSPQTLPPRAQGAFDAMVVGTTHKGHLLVADYPLSKLDALLEAYRPDLVLVEIRPEAFALGHYEDGPAEMSYVTLRARARGIAVEPIDWYLDRDVGVSAAEDPPAEQAYEHAYADLEKAIDRFDTFAALNDPSRDLAFLDIENARARFGLASEAHWHQRQAWFHFRALEAVRRHHAGRAAAFVGFAHRPELQAFLRTYGASVIAPTTVLTAAQPAAVRAPDDVIAFWREGARRLHEQAAIAAPAARQRLAAKARYWDVVVERGGTCCVDEAYLEPRP